MLIEFSVTNFRSFRERQTLSMVAVPRLHKKENIFQPELNGEKGLKLLKAAVIYGPNASGKSNLLKALKVVSVIASREVPASRPLPVQPFAFDQALADQPSEFEMHFVHQGTRYQFELAATADQIVFERLVAYPKGNPEEMYCRSGQDESNYSFGPAMDTVKDVLANWIKLTPPRVLFIAQAVANSNDGGGPLKIPFDWLRGSMLGVMNDMSVWTSSSLELAQKRQAHSQNIAAFLRELDVPISSINVKQEDMNSGEQGGLAALVEKDSLSASSALKAKPISRTFLTHQSALGTAELSLNDESAGTRNLIGFWLPWATKDPSSSSNLARCILVVDELDSSLHPKIVESLVAKHIKSEFTSQLIFTTHDTHLMDSKMLRRDQIWITERDPNGATKLRSIHDFAGREGEDVEKRYYEGRYRGLPLVRAH